MRTWLAIGCLLAATCATAARPREQLSYASGRTLHHPRVLERTSERAKIVHDGGVGVFRRGEFSDKDWKWVQQCELGEFQSRPVARAPRPSPAPAAATGPDGLVAMLRSDGVRLLGIYAGAFALAIVVNGLAVTRLVRAACPERTDAGRSWPASLLRAVEQVLYVAAFALDKSAFIAAWVLAKTLAQSTRWRLAQDACELQARELTPYLLETALGVCVGVAGGLLVDLLSARRYHAWPIPALVLLGVWLLWAWAGVRARMRRGSS